MVMEAADKPRSAYDQPNQSSLPPHHDLDAASGSDLPYPRLCIERLATDFRWLSRE